MKGLVGTVLVAVGAVAAVKAVPRVRRLRKNVETLAGVHVGSAINPAAHIPD